MARVRASVLCDWLAAPCPERLAVRNTQPVVLCQLSGEVLNRESRQAFPLQQAKEAPAGEPPVPPPGAIEVTG